MAQENDHSHLVDAVGQSARSLDSVRCEASQDRNVLSSEAHRALPEEEEDRVPERDGFLVHGSR